MNTTKTAFQFATPARQIDFPANPALQAALQQQWHTNLNGFTQQAILGDPWNSTNASPATNYFNPVDTSPPAGAMVAPITWSPFPGRIQYYFPNLSSADMYSLADTGYDTHGQSFSAITNPCTQANSKYGPYGPRGWQDEYCEWSVRRNKAGKIVRIDFTCENPEYWNSLWLTDPNQVLTLYQKTLDKPQIQLTDLYLRNSNGQPVTDPSTGRPAYNPLNKWNNGTHSDDSAGGAMHLTSTPNTLQTEIGLAASSTIQRTCGNSNLNTLICCAQYGQPYRNSDPHIGGMSNRLVATGRATSLTNPPGLYIQMPDFSQFANPNGPDNPASFWTIVRGKSTMNGDDGKPLPGNFILHATFEVPAKLGYTVSDLTINGSNINWAGQIAQTFLMQIVATAVSAKVPPVLPCVGTPTVSLAQPLQLFYADVYNAMVANAIPNPVKEPMNLLSNSTLIAPLVKPGTTVQMVLTAVLTNGRILPTITFEGNGDIVAKVSNIGSVTYAVPGNSYPSVCSALYLTVSVAQNAPKGLRGVRITSAGQSMPAFMPAVLNIV